jgi:hypothetical protein
VRTQTTLGQENGTKASEIPYAASSAVLVKAGSLKTGFLFEHDPFGKPVHAFPDRALFAGRGCSWNPVYF